MDKRTLIDILKNEGINDNNIYINKINSSKEFTTVSYRSMYRKNIKNNYNCMSSAKDKLGVYFFHKWNIEKNKFEFIYVGECHTTNDERDLKIRISQHLTAYNTGGFPYKLDGKNGLKAENIIKMFYNDDVKITYITLENVSSRDIIFLESFLISILRPKYNFYLK
ncbi:hypothetical protein [Clostridium perfringens]|uniref:hypothetical protein n=1 Tax=Clostridium perfringens TaxID=1502 RepID=UPI00096A6204|nr:hypothetical protein [Clostridium perfringens]MBI6053035.1 hypothetical protein [Clostridium perfringens]MDK0537649.1 hypothetical protein [Clostridium perfringens]MDK0829757.1 hypothetical protein [Clostridium perfringens]MDK0943487.1 hypothetical protein [Clostridium perfringens]MDK0960979.1 hypothetical protein [Clostridium perfringens]